ncbi:transcriptional regulator, XRE family [Haladaptatus litoreus]|uniref:Transcriptional regulator, XRE family n=1 Tax=Haladaptatus litoreus TaxID=553468 RepID=A0A1N6XNF2_9EURY|nr:multiprotein bridging factor aMBF1 [Haladaptatus litoreus]SIR03888.1 transcriptional regulator, XRE family [Haladaptatus litoreus]
MVQCEMCGAETASPKKIKVEGAELDVCDNCVDFGTEVKTQQSSTTSTKYSTSSSSGKSSGSSGTSRSSSSGGSRSRPSDMFDDMDEIVQDYDDRIRDARESIGLSQEDLAKELNEKASLIRKLERGDMLPSDRVQKKLEKKLEISLTAGSAGADDEEWSGGSSTDGTTLGDVVKRKD